MCICDLIRSLGTHMAKHTQSKCTRRDEKSTLGVRSAAEQSNTELGRILGAAENGWHKSVRCDSYGAAKI